MTARADRGGGSFGRAVPVLVLLALALATGNAMLGVFSAVQEAAKAELGFSDFQMSLLNGLAVSLPLAALSVPIGLLVDRAVRVRLLVGTALAWTIGTLLTAIADSMALLFVARMLGGLGANISTTIAISLAADLSLPRHRGRSLLLLTIGKYAGTGLAFALGGWLLGYFLTHGGLAGLSAWRSIHLALGLVSLFVVLAIAMLSEPERQERQTSGNQPVADTFRALLGYRRVLAPLFVGQTSVLMADAAATIWAAPVLGRNFGLAPQDFAGWMGAVVFGAGILGALAGGLAADLGQRSGKPGGILIGAVIASLLALPAALFPLAGSLVQFAALLFILLLGGTITGLVTATALAVLLPNELRGLSVGTFIAIGGVIAFGLAPSLVAGLAQGLGGEAQIGPALAIIGLAAGALGCGGFMVTWRRLAQPVI